MDGKPRDAHFPRQDLAIADKMNQLTKVVFSKTKKIHVASFRVCKRRSEEEIKQLKKQEGKDMILFGSASLAYRFIRSGIVDEYHLWIHPVILGSGKPIFYHLQKQMKLKLKDSVSFDSGVVANYYCRL